MAQGQDSACKDIFLAGGTLARIGLFLYHFAGGRRCRSGFGLVDWSSTVGVCLYLFGPHSIWLGI